MKKRKILKFIISGMLIISCFYSTTFASFTNADSSIFITKAEFESDFVNLKSRLTTLEAGINSKIDSQVIAYLERNGVWSGKKQDIMLPGNNYVIAESYHSRNCSQYYNTNNEIPYGNAFIVKSLSKTGLAVINYDYTSVNYWNYRYAITDTYASATHRYGYWYDAWYQFDTVKTTFVYYTPISQQGGKLLAKTIIAKHNPIKYITTNVTSTGGVPWACDIPELHCNRYFFVEKDTALLWQFAAACGGEEMTAGTYQSYEANRNGTAGNFSVVVY